MCRGKGCARSTAAYSLAGTALPLPAVICFVMRKAILHLNLKKKWYDMIASNKKLEEYREIKPYWERVFVKDKGIKIKGEYYKPSEVAVCFSQGYRKGREQMILNLAGVAIREGKKEWGALPNTKYFVLSFEGETSRSELAPHLNR